MLIRPDQHVAWRGNRSDSLEEAKAILDIVRGRVEADVQQPDSFEGARSPKEAFTGTVEMKTQVGEFELEGMGDFQR